MSPRRTRLDRVIATGSIATMATFSLPVTIFFGSASGLALRVRLYASPLGAEADHRAVIEGDFQNALFVHCRNISRLGHRDHFTPGCGCAARALRPARRRRAYPPTRRTISAGVGLRLSAILAMTGALIGIGADGDIERHFAEKRNAELFGFFPRASCAKTSVPARRNGDRRSSSYYRQHREAAL